MAGVMTGDGSNTQGGAGSGGALGTGGATLKGGAGNVPPTKTPIQYRDDTNWPTLTLYGEAS